MLNSAASGDRVAGQEASTSTTTPPSPPLPPVTMDGQLSSLHAGDRGEWSM